jgi:hypothetical protein
MSCKKDPDPQQLFFLPSISSDVINWDSISYTIINYSDMNELKAEEIENPNAYTKSINIDIRNECLTLDAKHTFVMKKFDMIGKSGKIIYYVPFNGESAANGISFKLPYVFQTTEGRSNLSFHVIKYSE